MPGLRVGLANVGGGCSKPGCTLRAPIHRHHRAHEALWFGAWGHRFGPRWEAFRERYYKFLDEDTVRLCANHHAEIHWIYDSVIADDIGRTGLPLYLYSWRQALVLMDRLRATCEEWLSEVTPGMNPQAYERGKKRRRASLKLAAEKKYNRPPTLRARRRSKLKKRRRRKPKKG